MAGFMEFNLLFVQLFQLCCHLFKQSLEINGNMSCGQILLQSYDRVYCSFGYCISLLISPVANVAMNPTKGYGFTFLCELGITTENI